MTLTRFKKLLTIGASTKLLAELPDAAELDFLLPPKKKRT